MPTKTPEHEHAEPEKQERPDLKGVISKQVLQILGEPDDLHTVQVRDIWENHYRVNVLVGMDAASARVAHSYFLTADVKGTILRSTPSITKQY